MLSESRRITSRKASRPLTSISVIASVSRTNHFNGVGEFDTRLSISSWNSPYERALNVPMAVVCKRSGKPCWLSSGTFWYESKDPLGPWAPTPSAPVYNTTHVHVYQSTLDIVYVGYTPGYLWS